MSSGLLILLSLITFAVIIGLVIFVHELGHFIFAKLFKVKVNQFSIGFGPDIWSKKRGETHYSIKLIPLGGFVSPEGESDVTNDSPHSFNSINRFKRAVILVAGVSMNFLLALVVFAVIIAAYGKAVPSSKVTINGVAPNSPAATAGIKPGDVVDSINGQRVSSLEQLQSIIRSNYDHQISLTVDRSDKSQTMQLTPRSNPPSGQGAVGVILGNDEVKFFPWYQLPIEAVKTFWDQLVLVVSFLASSLAKIPSGKSDIGNQLSGPIGITYITYQALKIDPAFLLSIIAQINISVALINLLPIPPLDGGRLAFVGLSALFRRNFYPKLENYVALGGWVFFVGLMVFVTFNDVHKLITTTSILDKLRGFF